MTYNSQIFYKTLHTEPTRKAYKIHLEQFFKYADTDYDHILKLSTKEIKEKVQKYVLHLIDLTDKIGVPNPNSYNPMMTPIQRYLELHEIEFSWKNIKKFYPTKVPTANKLAYTDDDIRELLGATTSLRNKAFIHFLASTGVRVGSTSKLKIEDVKEIENGAIVTIYKDEIEEYRTCLTPEAHTSLKKYLAQRIDRSSESVLFTKKNNLSPLTPESAQDIVRNVRKQAKLSVDNGRKTTKGKSQNHAFRKRFKQILSINDVQESFTEYMMGHFTGNSMAYFSSIPDEKIYNQFKRAIPELTLDKSQQMETKHKEEIEIIKEEYDGAIKEKLEKQDELMQKMALSLATTKYMMYEKMYAECFGGENPNLEKLSKLMSNEEIADWNSIISIVQREKDWTISKGTESEVMLRDSKQKNEIKEIIELAKKSGDTESIEMFKKMLEG